MELLRSVIVFLHIVGFAITFGSLVGEAAAHRFQFTKIANYGLLVSLVTGFALAAPWGTDAELNYVKIGVKMVILVLLGGIMGMGVARERKTGEAPERGLFYAAVLLSAAAAGIAVIW
ncbi:MAG: Fe-S protein [Gordonia sp. (in: high G+C Gram-positive bacteria)]|uniref:Fe-S protein n=1 Tax=Gordonia sp. (in: high G+C Gram-positive bacteria) TaxID=84139 RepID=UPI0039E6A7C3